MPSRIYEELSYNQLKRLVEENFGTDSFEYSIKTGGMFNTTYVLTIENEKYILRVGPINRELLLPFENSLMDAQVYFEKMCAENGVSVSELVVCDTSKTLFDRDYMIVRFIESMPLSEIDLSDEEKDEIYRATGEYAAKINAIKGKCFGRLSLIIDGYSFDKWSDYLLCEIDMQTKALSETGLYTVDELNRINEVYKNNTELLDEIRTPYLVHADLWSGNVLVSIEEGKHRVCAIIDGDRALFGDPEVELASGWMINDSFIAGYGHMLKDDKNSVKRRKMYSLFFNLIDSYVLINEYDRPEDAVINKNTVLNLLEEIEQLN